MLQHINYRDLGRFWSILRQEGLITALVKTRRYLRRFENERGIKNALDSQLIQNYLPVNLKENVSEPDVSIIIPVFNQWRYTYNCIRSIADACTEYSYEVILADDGSTDATLNISKVVKNITVIRDGKNRKFVRNCNHASTFARGKFLYFLNNDTKLQPHAIDELVKFLISNPSVGIAGSKLIFEDGSLQEAGGILWADGTGWNYGRGQDRSSPEFCYFREVDYVSGASLMVRRDLWKKAEGFDERFAPAYCEDSDLCMKVRTLGYSTWYVPTSEVIHYEGKSNGIDVTQGLKQYQIANSERLADKWQFELMQQHYRKTDQAFLARNRAMSRLPVILVIDHYVPQYDRDAGSRTMWAFLKSFRMLGYPVCFIGDNFTAHQPYTGELQALGIEVLFGKRFSDSCNAWLRENGSCIDIVLLSRPHIAPRYLQLVRKYTKAKVIYYGHDLHYIREMRRLEVPEQKPGPISLEKIKKDELALMSQMDLVLSCSHNEIDEIKRQLPILDVRYVPPYALQVSPTIYNHHQTSDILFVGGFSHTPNVDAILWFITCILPKILIEKPDVCLHVVGSDPPDNIRSLSSDSVRIHGRLSDTKLCELYNMCAVGVIPLRYGAGIKGKTVEAMAMGLPVITTPCGIEGLSEDFTNSCLIANDVDDFSKVTVALLNDSHRRSELSNSGKVAVEKTFSDLNMSATWKGILGELSCNRFFPEEFSKIDGLQFGKGLKLVSYPIGYYNDKWCSNRLSIELDIQSDAIVGLNLVIWTPSSKSSLMLFPSVNGIASAIECVPNGQSTARIVFDKKLNGRILLTIRSSKVIDNISRLEPRKLSFILDRIDPIEVDR